MTVAQQGEAAEPRVPAPAPLRPLLRFTRLSATAYGTVARVVDDDPEFRARVALAAEEESTAGIGRPGWLWLHRPDGWDEDPAWSEDHDGAPATPGAAKQRRQQVAAEAKARAARHRQAASDADEARRRAVEQLADARREAGSAAAERDRLQDRLDELTEERNRAVRASKALEADLAASRRDLKVAREAARQAEAELLAGRGDPRPSDAGATAGGPPPRARRPPDPVPPEATTVVAPLDRAAVASAVGAAAAASADLAQSVARAAAASTDLAKALAAAAVLLSPPTPTARRPLDVGAHHGEAQVLAGGTPTASGATPRTRSKAAKAGAKGRRPRRVPPTLPPGIFVDTPEAHRHLVGSGEPLLVVDGYNVARTAWPDLAPEEERRRTVALLEEVQARSGGPVVVVFDGDSRAVAPVASRSVRVRFSATGVTADDDIAALVATVPPGQPVVVVSSDREVADEARRLGAVVLSSPELLAAAGR